MTRVVSRFGDEGTYWNESAKMLANIIHAMRGTPYIYQGEELGMTNANFTTLEQYRDVESLNHYQILRDKGMSEESVWKAPMSLEGYRVLLSNDWDSVPQNEWTLRPYESVLLLKESNF